MPLNGSTVIQRPVRPCRSQTEFAFYDASHQLYIPYIPGPSQINTEAADRTLNVNDAFTNLALSTFRLLRASLETVFFIEDVICPHLGSLQLDVRTHQGFITSHHLTFRLCYTSQEELTLLGQLFHSDHCVFCMTLICAIHSRADSSPPRHRVQSTILFF